MKFKVGDWVRRTVETEYPECFGEKGKIYKITYCSDSSIGITDNPYDSAAHYNFELVCRKEDVGGPFQPGDVVIRLSNNNGAPYAIIGKTYVVEKAASTALCLYKIDGIARSEYFGLVERPLVMENTMKDIIINGEILKKLGIQWKLCEEINLSSADIFKILGPDQAANIPLVEEFLFKLHKRFPGIAGDMIKGWRQYFSPNLVEVFRAFLMTSNGGKFPQGLNAAIRYAPEALRFFQTSHFLIGDIVSSSSNKGCFYKVVSIGKQIGVSALKDGKPVATIDYCSRDILTLIYRP